MHFENPPNQQRSFLDEQIAEERFEARHFIIRWIAGFAMLFAGVFFAFWWSGSAIQFSAARVRAGNAPTYRIWGTVRDAQSGQPIPWAAIEDDPDASPPFFRAQADANGAYSLSTLADLHRVRISAVAYRTLVIRVGKPWFVWWPRGEERQDVRLSPE